MQGDSDSKNPWILQGLEPLCHVHHTSTQGLLEHLFLQGLELERMRIFSTKELIWTTQPLLPWLLPPAQVFSGIIRMLLFSRLFSLLATVAL